MDIRKTFANNIREYRKATGLTQEGLAELSGLHRTYIGGIEQGRINVSLNNVSKIAEALNISPSLLFMNPAGSAAEVVKNINGEDNCALTYYALCKFRENEATVQPLNMVDVDIDTQILYSLIRDGVDDTEELAQKMKTTRLRILDYLSNHCRTS